MDNGSLKVLAVDDSPTQAELLRYLLENQGYNVAVAKNGVEALQTIGFHKPGLVVTDIVMPEMDGYALCRHIKADASMKDTPVILATTLSDPKNIINGIECGADSYIIKPYDEKCLASCISNTLANYELCRRNNGNGRMEVYFDGKEYAITADSLHILRFLFSTYETAVQKNQELVRTQEELMTLNKTLDEAFRNLSSTAEAIERERTYFKYKAQRDGLTGIFNRFSFDELLAAEMKRSLSYNEPLSLIMFDIDKFKHINDTYGHVAGDRILVGIAEIISRNIRETDSFARYGGEEFVLVIPGIELGKALKLADKLRAVIEGHSFTEAVRVTSSFGVTQLLDSEDALSFVKRTDGALYRAKNNGRNRVESG